jgi:zinc protease
MARKTKTNYIIKTYILKLYQINLQKMSTQHQTTKLTEPSHLPPAPLPPPPSSLCHSTLPNGFKYYIQPNSHPKNRIVAHLVVGVGSLAEKEHERGVAHFLEHLAFRGTNTFDHGELIKFFERSGMSFGHHVNAHTGQTETVYKLEAPAKDRQLLLKAIDVLAEWGTGGIRISDEDVQAERNIIEEEWRGREGVAQRMLESYWSRIFKNGGAQLYAERFPIGLLSVIRNVSSKVLQNFYNTWYRADTMAVIVSGDFQENSDIHVIENHIIEKFGKMPPPTIDSPKPPIAPNPKHPQALAVALTDSELTATAVNCKVQQSFKIFKI